MGCYDTVIVNCPVCNEEHYFQSKSGNCFLDEFRLEDCPYDVLVDVNRHSPYECDCGNHILVDIDEKRVITLNDLTIITLEDKKTKTYTGFLKQLPGVVTQTKHLDSIETNLNTNLNNLIKFRNTKKDDHKK